VRAPHRTSAIVLIALASACSGSGTNDGAPPAHPADQGSSAASTATSTPEGNPKRQRPEVNIQVVRERAFYQVRGSTATELRASVEAGGSGNGSSDARTDWRIEWRYTTEGQGGRCGILGGIVMLGLEITLPRWNHAEDASALANSWNAYTEALERHEQGHVSIATSAGKRMVRALRGLRRYPSCFALQRRADAALRRILRAHRSRQDAYDERTGHGAAQGVVFP
jgi:predicted secreted Zn-dependent protease